MPTPGGAAPPLERSKSLAERRNEWRAKRGLSRQKTVQELIAERRAAREAGAAKPSFLGNSETASTAAASEAPPSPALSTPPSPALSPDGALEQGASTESERDAATVDGDDSAREAKGRLKKKWPWRAK